MFRVQGGKSGAGMTGYVVAPRFEGGPARLAGLLTGAVWCGAYGGVPRAAGRYNLEPRAPSYG